MSDRGDGVSKKHKTQSAFTIISSPAADVRLSAAHQFIRSHPSTVEQLAVGDTREAVDELACDVIKDSGAVFGIHRLSFYQLAAGLAGPELARRGLVAASRLGTHAVAARTAFDALVDESLSYLAAVARLRSFGQALGNTLDELRRSNIDQALLADHGDRGTDLQILARRYDEQLTAAGLVDHAALFRTAARSIEDPTSATGAMTVPIGGPLLLLDVAIHDEATFALARAVWASASHVLATVPSGDDRSLKALVQLPEATVEYPPSASENANADGLDRVRTYLFAADVPSASSPSHPESSPEVRLFSAPGEDRECVEIARAALREAERGVPLDRMAILVRSPELYAGLLETALTRAGIRGWFVGGTRAPDPAGRAFLAILACAAEQLSARRFAEYLSLAQVPPLTKDGHPPTDPPSWVPPDGADAVLPVQQVVPTQPSLFDEGPSDGVEDRVDAPTGSDDSAEPRDSPDQPVVAGSLRAPLYWDRLLVESAVIGGRDRWARRLDGLSHELEIKRDEQASEEPESPRVRALDRDLRNLDHLRRFALPIVDVLAALPARATWGDWLDRLERLAPMVLKQPDRVLAVLGELRPMARVGPVPLAEVQHVLVDRLAGLQQTPPSTRYGHIFVGRPDQVRGRVFDVVFVPGLAERLFPQKQRQDPLLLDDIREALNRASPDTTTLGLPTRDDRAASERLLLRLAVGASSARLYLSYPRLQLSEARARVPSFYALDLERARIGRVPEFQELQREADRLSGARLAWPAPNDARLAIDDTEHDLAVLGPLLKQEVTAIEGRARYLLTLNPGLRRSLLTRWARWGVPWSRYDGLYGMAEDSVARTALAAQSLTARPYSVSALQRFARCPYQFLLATIYRLEPREEIQPLERMDPLTRGRLFHEVQAEFVRALKETKALPVTTDTLRTADRVLDTTLDRVADAYKEDLAPAIDRVWADEIESMRIDLKGWLQRVAEEGGEWIPIHAEFGFGFGGGSGRDAESLSEPVRLDGKWQLRGVVDLIEAKAGPTSDGGLRVTDHKTGRDRTRDRMVVGHGEVLQPVLYGLAVEHALARGVHASRLFFGTVAGAFGVRSVTLGDRERRQGIEVLEVVDRALIAGELLPAPREGACRWCDFREVCGPWEETRVRKKDQSKLADLAALRRMP